MSECYYELIEFGADERETRCWRVPHAHDEMVRFLVPQLAEGDGLGAVELTKDTVKTILRAMHLRPVLDDVCTWFIEWIAAD